MREVRLESARKRGWLARRVLLALGVVVTAACAVKSDRYCDETTRCQDPATPYCDLAGEYEERIKNRCVANPWACASSAECGAATPICAAEAGCRTCSPGTAGDAECAARDPATPYCLDDGGCGGCRDGGDCPTAAAPACDGTAHVCRPCAEHADCASGVCDRAGGGACVAPADTVFVAADGTDAGECTAAAPCLTVGFARGKVTLERATILLAPGVYEEPIPLTVGGVRVAIIGSAATLRSQAPGPVVRLTTGARVVIDGLTIEDAVGESNGAGITCETATAALTLIDAVVRDNQLDGVQSTDCTVTVTRATITGNGWAGIKASGGTVTAAAATVAGNGGDGVAVVDGAVTIARSRITANQRNGVAASGGAVTVVGSTVAENDFAGIDVANAAMTIENDYVVGNHGFGVRVSNENFAGTPQELRFNTIAENDADYGNQSSGVMCVGSLTARNNIIYSLTSSLPSLSGTCAYRANYVEEEHPSAPPLFANWSAGDFHLLPTSPCRGAGEPIAEVTDDFDGDSRPRPEGTNPDLGADEVP